MLEVKHLKTIIALQKTGSLVEAAESLYMTQSALSHQIKDIELRLNTRLFIRKTRPLRFTVAGEQVLKLAKSVLPMFAGTERDINRLLSGNAGRLHMAIECHSCFQWLMQAIDLFRDQWPEVDLDLTSGFSFAPLAALKRGDIDLVVTSNPQKLPGIHYQALFSYQPMLVVSHQHALADKDYILPEDLSDETLITYPIEQDRLDIFNLFLDPAGVSPNSIRHAELTLMMLQLVASGRGVAALPNWALSEYLQQEHILAKPLGEESCWATLYMAIRVEQLDSSYMRVFLKEAKRSSFEQLKGIKAVQ